MTQILHKTTTQLTFPSGATVDVVSSYTDTTITEIRNQEIVLAASSTITLWNTADTSENINTLRYCYIQNTGTGSLEVEFVVDDDASVGEELHTVELPSGAHHTLFSGVAYANHSAGDAFGGTKDVIERIRVKEPNASAGAVRFVLGGT